MSLHETTKLVYTPDEPYYATERIDNIISELRTVQERTPALTMRVERIIGALIEEVYTGETRPLHAQPGAIAASLADGLADARHSATGLIAGILIGVGIFLLGYRIGYATGILQPWVDARGWIALLFLAIGVPVIAIWHANKRGGKR